MSGEYPIGMGTNSVAEGYENMAAAQYNNTEVVPSQTTISSKTLDTIVIDRDEGRLLSPAVTFWALMIMAAVLAIVLILVFVMVCYLTGIRKTLRSLTLKNSILPERVAADNVLSNPATTGSGANTTHHLQRETYRMRQSDPIEPYDVSDRVLLPIRSSHQSASSRPGPGTPISAHRPGASTSNIAASNRLLPNPGTPASTRSRTSNPSKSESLKGSQNSIPDGYYDFSPSFGDRHVPLPNGSSRTLEDRHIYSVAAVQGVRYSLNTGPEYVNIGSSLPEGTAIRNYIPMGGPR